MTPKRTVALATLALVVAFAAPPRAVAAPDKPAGSPPAAAKPETIARGQSMVTLGGCHDCHSPKIFGPQGPEPDPSRLLSGHPRGTKLPPVPAGLISPEGWGSVGTNDMTAWVGPWGTSFGINLTPDVDTGIGSWSEAMFIKAIRTGKHMGEGRPILPPMPWMGIAAMSDADLKALFAYLRTVKPISNAVPDPLPPAGAPGK